MKFFLHPAPFVLVGFGVLASLGCFDLKKSGLSESVKDFIACSACTRANCEKEIQKCAETPTCSERQSCIDTCLQKGSHTSACDAQCLQNEHEYGLHTDVSICQSRHCADECHRQCGGFTYSNEKCDSCMKSRCCEESQTCANLPACLELSLCLSECVPGDWGCEEQCYSSSAAEVKNISDKYLTCIDACAEECGAGSAWSCVHQPDYLKLESAKEITISIFINNILYLPIKGASCAVCRWDDPDCLDPVATAESGGDGWVHLTYFFQYLYSDIRVEISKPGYVDATLTFSRVLTGSPYKTSWPLLTPAQLKSFYEFHDITILPDRGHAVIELSDCNLRPGRELVAFADGVDDSNIIYFRDGSPDKDAYHTGGNGNVAIVNLPPGPVSVEVAPFGQEDNVVLRENITIRPGAMSYVVIWPERLTTPN